MQLVKSDAYEPEEVANLMIQKCDIKEDDELMGRVLRIMALQNLLKKLHVYREEEEAMRQQAEDNPHDYRKVMNIPWTASGQAFVSVIDKLKYEQLKDKVARNIEQVDNSVMVKNAEAKWVKMPLDIDINPVSQRKVSSGADDGYF